MTGNFLSVSNAAYHSMPGVSNSRLKDYIADFRLYHYKYMSGEYTEERKLHFDIGQAVHDLTLLEDDAGILEIPDDVLASNGAKSTKAYKEFASENSGKLLLKADEMGAVHKCVNAIKASHIWDAIDACDVREKAATVRDHNLELDTRCKVDAYSTDRAVVIDLKTTSRGTTAGEFVKQAANLGYHRQHAFYKRVLEMCGIEVSAFIFVAVAVDPPHTVDSYILSDEFLQLGMVDVENGLASLAERTRANDWASPDRIVELSPPNYLRYAGDYAV